MPARSCTCPIALGLAFRSVADIRRMIAAGADKVSVNSAAVANPALITEAARAFGTQAILCAIDAKQVPGNPNKWEVYVAGGRKATGLDAVEWAVEAARRGAGEDTAHLHDSRRQPRRFRLCPYAGGSASCGRAGYCQWRRWQLEHFAQGILEGEADAVLAASVFHFGEFTVRQVKESMASYGIPVRL